MLVWIFYFPYTTCMSPTANIIVVLVSQFHNMLIGVNEVAMTSVGNHDCSHQVDLVYFLCNS